MDKKDKNTSKRREWLFALIWFTAAAALYAVSVFVLKDWLRYFFILPAAVVFYVLRLVILLPLSKKKRSKINMRIRMTVQIISCLAVLIGLIVWRDSYSLPLYPYLTFMLENESENILSIEHEADGRFIINTQNDTLKVLQLTDIHIGGTISTYRQDYAAFHCIYEIVRQMRPDLIIITGDLVFPLPFESLSTDNRTPLVYLCDFMQRIGIPWAFVYGNHETELVAQYTADELNNILDYYTFDLGGCLLFSRIQPDVYGRYNNLIEVRNADGSLNQALFLLDSNDYASNKINDYDCIHSDQIEWYKSTVEELNAREGKTVSSMLYFHIPLPEFEEAYQALLRGSNEAELLFGERREGCACSDKNSGLFDVIKELGSTKAVFCGHDHLNDAGIRYQGVDLVYGRSIDFLAYPGIDKMTQQRGATMVTLLPESEYEYTLWP